MRASIVLAGVLVLALAIGIVLYINTRGPSETGTIEGQTPVDQAPAKTDEGLPSPKPNQPAKKPKPSTPAKTKEQKIADFLIHSQVHEQTEKLKEFFTMIMEHVSPEERQVLEPLVQQLLRAGPEAYKKALSEKFSESELEELDAIYRDASFSAFNSSVVKAWGLDPAVSKHMHEFDIKTLAPDRREALDHIIDAELATHYSSMEAEMDLGDGHQFKELLKEMLASRLGAITEGQSVEDLKYIATQLNQPLIVSQRRLQMQVFENSMKAFNDAAEQLFTPP